jgi:2-keto-4-pentenoate hydratase
MALPVNIQELSNYLLKAERDRKGVKALTDIVPDISIKDAYHVQLATIKRKIDDGQVIVGKKIGLTSVAMQKLLGVDEPDYGHLLNEMAIENEGVIDFNYLLQPKVEAEIAFILKNDLEGPNVTTKDVLDATESVVPALEIIDSRILDWKIKLPDTIADNASSGLFVLGDSRVPIEIVNLPKVKMNLYKNGELINEGEGSAVLGDPAYCVAWLANKLSEFGISLKKGEVILSGALSAAVDAKPGDVFMATFDSLGNVSVQFEKYVTERILKR